MLSHDFTTDFTTTDLNKRITLANQVELPNIGMPVKRKTRLPTEASQSKTVAFSIPDGQQQDDNDIDINTDFFLSNSSNHSLQSGREDAATSQYMGVFSTNTQNSNNANDDFRFQSVTKCGKSRSSSPPYPRSTQPPVGRMNGEDYYNFSRVHLQNRAQQTIMETKNQSQNTNISQAMGLNCTGDNNTFIPTNHPINSPSLQACASTCNPHIHSTQVPFSRINAAADSVDSQSSIKSFPVLVPPIGPAYSVTSAAPANPVVYNSMLPPSSGSNRLHNSAGGARNYHATQYDRIMMENFRQKQQQDMMNHYNAVAQHRLNAKANIPDKKQPCKCLHCCHEQDACTD